MFDKIYKDKNKFSDTDDNFNLKITIFYDNGRQVGLPTDAYIYDTSIMLSGQTQTYYYANWSNTSIFNQFCTNI